MAILTADHVIGNLKEFHRLLEAGYQHAMEGRLVTLGIRPEYPSSGYGYIKVGEPINGNGGYLVEKFVEKPNLIPLRIISNQGIITGIPGCSSGGQIEFWKKSRIICPPLGIL